MTLMRDIIHQVETVIDDNEYPATLDELVVIERILIQITLFHTSDEETNPAVEYSPGHRNDRFFPAAVFDYLRQYESHRKVPGKITGCHMPVSRRSGIAVHRAGISCPTS